MKTSTLVLLLLVGGALLLTVVILATRQPAKQESGIDNLIKLGTAFL